MFKIEIENVVCFGHASDVYLHVLCLRVWLGLFSPLPLQKLRVSPQGRTNHFRLRFFTVVFTTRSDHFRNFGLYGPRFAEISLESQFISYPTRGRGYKLFISSFYLFQKP